MAADENGSNTCFDPYLVLRVARDFHPSHGVHELEVRHQLLAVRCRFSRQWQGHLDKQKQSGRQAERERHKKNSVVRSNKQHRQPITLLKC